MRVGRGGSPGHFCHDREVVEAHELFLPARQAADLSDCLEHARVGDARGRRGHRRRPSLILLLVLGCNGRISGLRWLFLGDRLIVEELAPGTVRAVKLLVEPFALLGLVVARLVLPLLELLGAVGERTRVRVLAGAVELPELADLSLKLHFEALLTRVQRLLKRWATRCTGSRELVL